MRNFLLTIIIFLCSFTISIAQQPKEFCTSVDHHIMDFWVGSWDLTWQGGKGTNTITKTHGGCVVQEDFNSANLNGLSISSYDINAKTWRQIWVDNQNGFLNLFGKKDGENFIFHTTPNLENPNIQLQMVFSDIKKDSFIWTWQRTESNGEEWNNLWQISYKRQAN